MKHVSTSQPDLTAARRVRMARGVRGAAARAGAAALVAALAATALPAQAQALSRPGTPLRPLVSQEAVTQKIAMVERVLSQPSMTARIQAGDAEARSHWTAARELYTHARALSGSGILRGADALLNEAIWEIGRAQQAAPDLQVRLREERDRYTQLNDSVDALVRTYEIGLHPGAVTGNPNEPGERALQRAMAAREQARTLAQTQKYAEANRLLDDALSGLLKDSAARVRGQTLVYDRRFATPKDEFQFEIDRNRSLEGLVPLALVEFRPTPEAIALIDRYVKQNTGLRERAEAQAAGGDPAAGLKTLNEGTDALQRALQAAGLHVPQTMGSQ
jgi:hypothetical protein